MSSCFNRLCSSKDCVYKHAGDKGFIPSPCPYGKDCKNDESCQSFHEHHVHTLRNCDREVMRRFQSCLRHGPPSTVDNTTRAEWRKLARLYITTGKYDKRIDEIRAWRGKVEVSSFTRKRSRSPSRSSSPSPSRSRTRSLSSMSSSRKDRTRSPSMSSSNRSRSRSPATGCRSATSLAVRYGTTVYDETVDALRRLKKIDVEVVLSVVKALAR